MLWISPGRNGSKSWVVHSETKIHVGLWVNLSRVEELSSGTDGQTGMADLSGGENTMSPG